MINEDIIHSPTERARIANLIKDNFSTFVVEHLHELPQLWDALKPSGKLKMLELMANYCISKKKSEQTGDEEGQICCASDILMKRII